MHGSTSSSWQSFAVSGAMLTQAIEWKIFNFHLMYLSKEHINLNGKKWLVDARADIVITYLLSVFNIGNSSHGQILGSLQHLFRCWISRVSFNYLENMIVLFALVICLSDNFFQKINENLCHRFLLVLVLLVNFGFS